MGSCGGAGRSFSVLKQSSPHGRATGSSGSCGTARGARPPGPDDVIDGSRAKKMHTESFAAYASVNAPLARITPQGVQWKERRPLPEKPPA